MRPSRSAIDRELCGHERRLLDLRLSSHMWIIDAELTKMNAELTIDPPKAPATGKAA
jgi:hypothetical protein